MGIQLYVALAVLALISVALTRRLLLPRPVPGIPYDKASSERLLGDIPDAQRVLKESSQIRKFLNQRCKQLGPICQVWMQPFAPSWVIVNDYAQSEDILLRRTREFDRAPFHLGFLTALIPNGFGSKKTHDPRYAMGKRYLGDTMSTAFLHDVATLSIRTQTLKLIEMWRHKKRLAEGRPFDARQDLQLLSVDVAWSLAYGEDIGACDSQIRLLVTKDHVELPPHPDTLAHLPVAGLSAEYEALCLLSESAGIAIATPLGSLGHYLALKIIPKFRHAVAVKEKYVKASLLTSWERMRDSTTKDRPNRAVDLIMKREIQQAEREQRPPNPLSRELHDESFSFVLGGTDTTTAVMTWGIKYLTHHQDVQKKLRDVLKTTFAEETRAGRQLDPQTLAKAHLPYLDAFSEEVLRHCGIAVVVTRVATVDSQVMGHIVPKGTQLFFPGDMCTRPSSTPDGKLRAQSPLDAFDPQRWLTTTTDGELRYDPNAAPMQSFGGGVRGCFGKRLAYLNLKLFYAYAVWNFEMLPTPTSGDFRGHDAMGHLPNLLEIRLRDTGIITDGDAAT